MRNFHRPAQPLDLENCVFPLLDDQVIFATKLFHLRVIQAEDIIR